MVGTGVKKRHPEELVFVQTPEGRGARCVALWGESITAEGRTMQKPHSGGILQGTQPEVNNGGEAGDETRERMVHKLHKTP